MGQGFFYTPLNEVGAPDDFDAQQKELERRRKLASALSTQLGPAPANYGTKAMLGHLLGNALSGGVQGMQEAELDKQGASLSERKSEFTRKWLESMPRGTPEQ